MPEWRIEETRYKPDRFDPIRVVFMLCEGDRRVARLDDREMAERLVAALAAHERETMLTSTIEAQRDAELALMGAARPYSALHSYHQGRSEAFSSVLDALADQQSPTAEPL